jgi:hypothetical protein
VYKVLPTAIISNGTRSRNQKTATLRSPPRRVPEHLLLESITVGTLELGFLAERFWGLHSAPSMARTRSMTALEGRQVGLLCMVWRWGGTARLATSGYAARLGARLLHLAC